MPPSDLNRPKLAGPPGMRIRLVMGLRTVRPVVTGVFPPEDAAQYRAVGAALARMMERELPAIYERVHRDTVSLLLYGTAP